MSIRSAVCFLFLLLSVSAFAQEADLAVEKLGPSEAPAGSDVSYTVTVTNAGPDDAATVTLTDNVPAGMSFVSATQENGPTFTCDTTVQCTIATFPAGASATFTFVFHIDEPGEFLNTAMVASQTLDPNSENDTSIVVTTTPSPQADLFVQKSGPAAAAPDTDVTFIITLGNAGPDAAVDVLLTDNLPAPLTFVSFTQTSGPTMSCGTSTCTIASFPAGETATFELTGHVPPGTPPGTEITNVATIESENDPLDENNTGVFTTVISSADLSLDKSGPGTAVAGTTVQYEIDVTNEGPDAALNVVVDDPQICEYVSCVLGTLAPGQTVTLTANVTIPSDATSWSNTATVTTDSIDPDDSNDTDTVITTITQSADLRIEKTGPTPVVASNSITWTVTVFNDGPSDASDVVVTDTLPAGTTFVTSSCGTNPCMLGTLAAGASVVLTFEATVDPTTTGTIVNEAAVTSSTPDPDPADNTATFQTDVTPAPADVAVVKTGDAAVAVIGTDVTYTIVVTNNGPGPAANVVMSDTLPAGSTFVSSSCGANPCAIGTLAAGESATIELVVTMPSTPGTATNTATVSTTSTDPVTANDTSSFDTTVVPEPADLSITKTADRETWVVGGEVTYTIVVTNGGPGTATDVVVIDELPAGTTLVSASPGCTGTTTVTCTVGTLGPGSSATIELVVTLPSTPGPVTNTARVESSSTDPTPGNDAATNVLDAHLPFEAVPALSPAALAMLAVTLASVVLVVLRRAS